MQSSSFMELSSAQFDAAQSKADLVRLRITQADIRSARVGALVDQLMRLSDSREGLLRWKNKLIIDVEKPQLDLRDASEISEVVQYFRLLTQHWPFWLHYVEKQGGTVGTVLRLLIGTERMRLPDGRASLMLTNAEQLRVQAKWLFGQMKHLYRFHALPEAEGTAMAMAVTQAVNAMFHKT